MCDPTRGSWPCDVALLNNTFAANFASRKGGALRYENANFVETSLMAENVIKFTLDLLAPSKKLRRLRTIGGFFDSIKAPTVQGIASSNSFEENIAPYGADFGSFPKSLRYTVPENDSGAKINATDKTLTLAAGQTFRLEMEIID